MQDTEAEVTGQKLKIRIHKFQQKAKLQKSKNGKTKDTWRILFGGGHRHILLHSVTPPSPKSHCVFWKNNWYHCLLLASNYKKSCCLLNNLL